MADERNSNDNYSDGNNAGEFGNDAGASDDNRIAGSSAGSRNSSSDGSADSANGGDNRSGDGRAERIDERGTEDDGSDFQSATFGATQSNSIGLEQSNAESRNSGSGRGSSGTGRGRSRKSDSERLANSGNADGKTETKKLVVENSANVAKPKTGFIPVSSDRTAKFKKGYRPLMSKDEATQTAEGLFGMSSLFLGQHWILTDDEAEELGKQIAKVCEKFPVKVGENPEMLEKVFAIFGLTTAMVAVLMPRIQKNLESGNDGIIQQIAERNTAGNGKPKSNANGTANNGAGISEPFGEFSDAFNLQ